MNNVKELYNEWLKGTEGNEEMHNELLAIAGNDDEKIGRASCRERV